MKHHAFYLLTLLTFFALGAYAEPSPELVYNLKGTIVRIHTVTKNGGHGNGSGFVVAENLVATNCHVLANSAGVNINSRGDTYVPVAVRADWKHDICILRFEFLPLKPAPLGDSEKLVYETGTFSVGFSGGSPKPITTIGKIKALYPMEDSVVIRTSASFQMGASGSPLFDDHGQVIGMNTFKSPGGTGHFYNVPVKWIKAAIALPESEKIIQTDNPFWDAPLEKRPYWMQVVLPAQAGKWDDLYQIAREWKNKAPNDSEANYYLALAQHHLGQLPDAKAGFQKVLASNPHHSASILALAQIAKAQNNQTELTGLSQMLSVLDQEALETLNPPQQ